MATRNWWWGLPGEGRVSVSWDDSISLCTSEPHWFDQAHAGSPVELPVKYLPLPEVWASPSCELQRDKNWHDVLLRMSYSCLCAAESMVELICIQFSIPIGEKKAKI